MVASGQDLVVQYFVFAKAVVHAGMNRRSLYKVTLVCEETIPVPSCKCVVMNQTGMFTIRNDSCSTDLDYKVE